jgi:hypothetical protein
MNKENQYCMSVTQFLGAFFSNEEEIILRTIGDDRVWSRDWFCPRTIAELQEDGSTKNFLMDENKTKNIYFYSHLGEFNLAGSSIVRYNAFFVENYKTPISEQHHTLDNAPIPPSIKVEKKNFVCAYWLIEGSCSQADWADVQARLIAYFDGDEENKDPARLMSVPFFNQVTFNGRGYSHNKVKIAAFNPSSRVSVEEMKNAFSLCKTFVDVELKPEPNTKQPQSSLNSYGATEFSDRTPKETKEVEKQSSLNSLNSLPIVKDPENIADRKPIREIRDPEKENSLNSCISSFVTTKYDSFPTLDRKALYGIAGGIVSEIAKDSESHPAALLIQFLATFGNIVGFSPHFYTEADAQGVNLYTVVVGKSARGGRKGTSWGNINQLFSQVDEEWAANNLQSGGLSSGEGLITRLRDANGDDIGEPDKRLLVVEGEFASVLRIKGRETNILDAILRNAWDRKPLGKMLSSRIDSMTVTDPHFSFIGHITEEELKSLLKDVDAYNGYANRILWVCTRRTQKLPRGGGFFKRDITGYVEELRSIINSATNIGEMYFDDKADRLWTEFYLSIDDTETGMTAAVLARAEAQVIRLAMLYALLDKSEIIYRVHLEAALAMWQYCEDSVRYIFGKALSADAMKLLEAIRETGCKGLSRSDIITEVFNKNKSKADIDSWIAELRNFIIFDASKRLYFSKDADDTNYEFNEFNELKVEVRDSDQSDKADFGLKP